MKFIWPILVVAMCALTACEEDEKQSDNHQVREEPPPKPTLMYGLPVDSFDISSGNIQPNQFLSNLLAQYNVSYHKIDRLVKNSKEVFDVKRIRPGNAYTVLSAGDSVSKAEFFIYEKNAADYIVFCLGDSCYAYEGSHPVRTELREASGVINSSLYMTMQDQGLSPALAMEMADIYAWTIDFYRINKGDAFKVIYEEKYVDSTSIGIGDVQGIMFRHSNDSLYAFRYIQDSIPNYFDEEGQSLKKAFLKAPLKFSRISSGYTKKRFHPVLKVYKAHLGTDYAAPHGTPIMAVGDGQVTKSEFKKNNGNYVKIKHNSTYETQYLHMSKRAVKAGDYVRQGDIIGYVGSTGLATGPHVCFRFWKNGQQIDHRGEDFPPSDPIKEDVLSDYQQVASSFKTQLDAIELPVDSVGTPL